MDEGGEVDSNCFTPDGHFHPSLLPNKLGLKIGTDSLPEGSG